MRLVKFSTIISIVFLSLLFSCKKENNSSESNSITALSGKIQNWTLGKDKIIKIEVFLSKGNFSFGSAVIDSAGSFNISSLSVPQSDLLVPIGDMLGSSSVASDNTAKAFALSALYVYSDTTGNPDGYVLYKNNGNTTEETIGSISEWLIYTDKDVSVSGTVSHTDSYNFTSKSVNDLKLKAGWNKYYSKCTYKSTNSVTYLHTGAEPSGLKWYYTAID